MIIFKDVTDRNNTVYECDRCKERTNNDGVYRIYVRVKKNPKKKWDLCRTCYAMLCKGIEKGTKNKVNENF